MKINSLSFCDTDTKWNLSKVEFKNLTLLVGASGVGKTQILESILKLRAIVRGKSIDGTKWEINFTTLNNNNYLWRGEFEKKGKNILSIKSDEDTDENNAPNILFEEIFLNNKEVIKRDSDKIIFEGQKTVKLAQDKSVLNLLKEEELISPAFQAFQKIIFSDQVESKKRPQKFFNLDFITKRRILQKYKTIESIRESDENLITKLYLAFNNAESIMNSIKERFIDIFPFVLDVRIAPLDFDDTDDTPSILKEIPFIQIKEKNVEDWIIPPRMSSGMYRTLMHLSEIYLCPEGTIILIDEFENSLGVNCIDELTIDLQTSHRNLQFIITSHHPYIINHINFKNWKLVTRKGSQVTTREAADIIDFNKSKQQAFIQLTQLEEFTTGISE